MSTKSRPTSRAASLNNPAASLITAASRLADATTAFSEWAVNVKLDPEIQPVDPNEEILRPLSEIVQSTNDFPSWISNPDSIAYSLLKHDCKDLVSRLCDSVPRGIHPTSPTHTVRSGNGGDDAMGEDPSHIDPPQTSGPSVGSGDNSAGGTNNPSPPLAMSDEDPDLARTMSAIIGLVKHSRILFDDNIWTANEAELRSGVVNLLRDTYTDREHVTFRLERELKLPIPKDPRTRVPGTKPDALVFLEFPPLESYIDVPADVQKHYSCLVQISPPKHLHVIHSLVEYKRSESGKNQALMGLVSGLYQRLALGIMDQFVFATFQCAPTQVQVVAGIWRDQRIRVYWLATYSFYNPYQTTRFYLLHRAIKKLGLVYQSQIFELGRKSGGFPRIRSQELEDWEASTVSSSALRTNILGSVREGNEYEPRESGPPGNQDFHDSLKGLGQASDEEKMERFFNDRSLEVGSM